MLDKADGLRAKRRQALATLDTLLQSVFLDMFGDPVTNPKGWPKAELQCIIAAIIDCPHTTPRWTESGVLALRTSNLGYGEWQWDDTRYVNEAQYIERSKRGELEAGDVVLSREGTVGIAAIVPQQTRMCMGQRLVQVKPNRAKAVEQYLLYVLLYELAPVRIAGVMAGSTSKHLNVVELRELQIPAPTLSVQKQFAGVLDAIKKQRESSSNAASELDTLFAALQSAAFAGTLSDGEASKQARRAVAV